MPACFRPQMKRIIRERRVYVRAIPEMGAHEAAKCRSMCAEVRCAQNYSTTTVMLSSYSEVSCKLPIMPVSVLPKSSLVPKFFPSIF